MSLRDLMRADAADVFLSTDDLGQTATFLPHKATPPGNTSITVVVGDLAPSVSMIDGGQEEREQVTLFVLRSTMDAALVTLEGTARLPKRGDSFTIALGDDAGTYLVQTANYDSGGGVNITCSVNRLLRAAGQNAIQVR